jgi:hypothetical protein
MPAEKERPSLADYVALAFSPALIVGLVGSLVFFLLQVLYAGEYEGRLRWILFFFVLGAVLIARVSMTAGISNRAGLYGSLLGFLTWLGMQTFVDYKDTPVAEVSWLINLGLIGLVWWCAHRLTWDCTHVEEESDVGGGGLLEEAGFEKGAEAAPAAPPPEQEKEPAPGLAAWWQRYQRYREGRTKKRALGVWVVYFSLAALPIFGLGQSLIPSEDGAARRYVFWLMTVYVGCGLGLLLMTCFLGLRRYLRQRKLRMPAAMTGIWLSVGGTLTLLLLLAGAFLPRPSAEYPLFDFTPVGAEKLGASDYALKNDGRGEGKGKPGNVGDPKAESGNAQGKGGEPGGEGGKGKGGSGQGNDGSGQGENNSSGGQNSSGQSQDGSGQDKAGQGKDDAKEKGSGKAEQSRDGGKGSDQDKANQQGGDKAQEKAGGNQAGQKEKGSGGGRSENKRSGGRGGRSGSSSGSSSSTLSSTARTVANVLKWVVFAVLAVVVGFFLLRGILGFLANFTGWARNLLAALQNFWASLFGARQREKKAEEEEAAAGPQARSERPFSSFSNPFEDGSARRMSVQELIRYTFAAVQAWARERDLGRQPGETALEFVGRVSNEVPALEDALRPLVMLYGRAVYSRGSLPANAVETVRAFWERLEAVVEQPLSA